MTPTIAISYPIDPPNVPGGMTYNYATNPAVSRIRRMIADTVLAPPTLPLFTDAEISDALVSESSQGIYVSGMANQGAFAVPVPAQVFSYYRSAALLLENLAANKALLASVQKLLDVNLDTAKASRELRALADDYRKTEANAGHFAIAEQVYNQFGARERIWKQLLRLYGA